jgi:hypothetical protein
LSFAMLQVMPSAAQAELPPEEKHAPPERTRVPS